MLNAGFSTAPAGIRNNPFPDDWGRRGNLGVLVCPSQPAEREYLSTNWGQLFDRFSAIGLDFLVAWPYDEGGCGCPDCWPWGAKGFLTLTRSAAKQLRERYPCARLVLSTWMFDSPPAGEWVGLAQALDRDKEGFDAIMADAHEDFHRYPLDQGVPGNLPLVNFPEISMWGLHPWGGFGATALPGRLERLWHQAAARLAGGMPYSEGIYEDLNKVIYSQFYWRRDASALGTVKEYAAFHFSPAVADDIVRVARIFEQNQSHEREDKDGVTCIRMRSTADADEAYRLVTRAEAALSPQARASWRWRQLRLRALIDDELATHDFRVTERCAAAFGEIRSLYHAEKAMANVCPYADFQGVIPAAPGP